MKRKLFDSLHYIIGFLIGLLLNVTFSGIHFIIQGVIACIVMLCLGFGYEWFMASFYKGDFTWSDIKRGIVGCLIAVILI